MNKKDTKEILELENQLNEQENSAMNLFLDLWKNNLKSIELNTSGSTGTKKTIIAQKEQLLASAQMTGRFFNFSNETIALHCLPMNFIAGKMMLIRILAFQMKGIFVSATEPLSFSDSYSIDFAAMTPHQYQKCMAQNKEKLGRIKTVLLGGSNISKTLEEQITAMPHQVYHSYGMTETFSHVALRKVGEKENFKALHDITFEISESKTIIIHAPNLNVTHLKTNDIVELISPKEFRYIGRADFVVNSGGVKLYPEEIEQKLSLIFGKTNFFLAGTEDALLGQSLALFIEDEHFELPVVWPTNLQKFEKPKHIVRVKSFVYTESGKVNRIETQKLFEI